MATVMHTGTRYSNGAKAIATLLGIKRIKVKGSKYYAKPGDVIINWGANKLPPGAHNAYVKVINEPPLDCTNKLKTFKVLEKAGVSIPQYTTDKEVVRKSIHGGEGTNTWLARHTLVGKGGEGISIVDNFLDVPDAPLYTKYIPKKYEVRIHVAKGEVFDVQQKRKKEGAEASKIRSHGNGYIFARNDISIPADSLNKCKAEAIKAVKALGMDFGACDVIFNEQQDKAYVLEVNSAPGVEGTTAQNYANMLKGLINDRV